MLMVKKESYLRYWAFLEVFGVLQKTWIPIILQEYLNQKEIAE